MAGAVRGRSLVICAVTADECQAAAVEAAAALTPGTLYLDLNSVSPRTRAEAARAIEAGGGGYVEAAVMSPIAPKRLASPVWLGGTHARDALPLLQSLGFRGAAVYSATLGARVRRQDVPQRHRQGDGGAARRVTADGAPSWRRGRGARLAP